MYRFVRKHYLEHITGHLGEYSDGKVYKTIIYQNYPRSLTGIIKGIESLRQMIRVYYINTGASTGKVRGAVQEMNHALKSAYENVTGASHYSDMAHFIAEDVVKASQIAETKIYEIKNSAELISETAEEIHIDSKAVKELSQRAFTAMEDATKSFRKLAEASAVMAGKVKILTENTSDIDSLLSVIQEIASQTDMLALNAAIEAARAGEQGRGFSIVADEIQKLSGEASRAAESANRLLAQVNKGIRETSEYVKSGEGVLKEGAAAVVKGRNIISDLFDRSKSIEEKTSSARQAAAEQLNSTAVIAEFSGKTAETCRSAAGYTETVTSLMSMQRELFDEISRMGVSLDKIADDLVDTGSMISILDTEAIENGSIRKRIDSLAPMLRRVADAISGPEPDAGVHAEKIKAIIKNESDIAAAWTNTPDGRFIVSIPPAGIANAGGREWFINAVRGDFFVSQIYISAISKNPCITISLPVLDKGKLCAVLGVDLKLE